MRVVDLIAKKRDGLDLSRDEIAFIVGNFTSGAIPDYQMAAMLMAIYFRGMTEEETSYLVEEMMNSGEVLDLSHIGPTVDKHSTGGVGDKVSITLAPLVASAGLVVPMMSGRGLGHTGGTLDKLEAIPGFRVDLTPEEFVRQLERIGVAMVGQTESIAPADRKLYALRDATATVESIPLIAGSIMSKKLATGARAIVFDVKTGSGAFMRSYDDSLSLARVLVGTAHRMGRLAVAYITDMNQPLGRAVGNALETAEAIGALKGEAPHDYMRLCLTLGAEMLILGGKAGSIEEGMGFLKRSIESGAAAEKMREMVSAQGGNPDVVDNPSLLPRCETVLDLPSDRNGRVEAMDTRAVGLAAMILGAGREKQGDAVDPAVGLTIEKKLGDAVERGEVLVRLHVRGRSRVDGALKLLRGAYTIGDGGAEPPPLIKSRVTPEGVERYI
ncbi:MAG: thymidine phosphorylase [bacterium]